MLCQSLLHWTVWGIMTKKMCTRSVQMYFFAEYFWTEVGWTHRCTICGWRIQGYQDLALFESLKLYIHLDSIFRMESQVSINFQPSCVGCVALHFSHYIFKSTYAILLLGGVQNFMANQTVQRKDFQLWFHKISLY